MGTTDTGEAKPQTIIVGPVAAWESMKMLGTNGGGFYGMNSAHPFENPTGLSNFFNTYAMMMFPFALVFMFGRMLNKFRHSLVIFAVMMVMMAGTIVWSIYFDTLKPNPGLTGQSVEQKFEVPSAAAPGGKLTVTLPAVPSLPVEQHLGNLEGKEMRFGTSAGATFDALTTDVTCGAVNAEEDSLNPVAAAFAYGRNVAQLRLRRQRRGDDKHVDLYHSRDFHSRHDGGKNAGISGKENRGT